MIDIEKEAKDNIRNKKFYEYYSEIMKISKQILDGKKSKECNFDINSSIYWQIHKTVQ